MGKNSSKNKKQYKHSNNTQSGIAIVLFVMFLLLLLNVVIFRDDSISMFKWYLMVALLGIPTLPVLKIFKGFFDKGYVFSKLFTLAFSAMLLFVLSSFKIIKFTTFSCFLSVIVVGIISYLVSYFRNGRDFSKIIPFDKSDVKMILIEETVIIGIFIMMMYIRGFAPSAYGTEKFMDYGFMTSILRTDYFPPEDFWYSGTYLNYYFIGQYFASFLTRLSLNTVEYTYNLMTMTICALGFIEVFSIVSTLFNNRLLDCERLGDELTLSVKSKSIDKDKLPVIAGTISAICACFMGNMHYVLYKFIAPILNIFIRGAFDEGYVGKNYWYPDATRFIGYHPETNDKTIHEFPCYSFVLNDLHAHVLNIVFVLLVLAVVLAYAINIKKSAKLFDFKNIVNPTVLLIGFLLGMFQGSNFWDFPIYFVTAFAVITLVNMRVNAINIKTFVLSLVQAVVSYIISRILIYPFSRNFNEMMSGVGIVKNRSMLHQLVILWGLPFAICIVFMVLATIDYRRSNERNRNIFKAFDSFMHKISIADFFVFVISFCAMGLVVMPEVVFVKDIYGEGYSRSNTMFKLTYQAFIMFAIIAGYVVVKTLVINVTKKRFKAGIVALVLLIGCTLYFFEAVHDSCGNVFDSDNFKGVSALYYLNNDETFSADKEMCDYINDNIKEKSTILESAGYSYTEYNRMSVVTGMPTVIGWETHEWLWKNDIESVRKRQEDVKKIYTSDSRDEINRYVSWYDIDYIYIGDLEYQKYEGEGTEVNINLLLDMYDVEHVVNSSGTGRPSYLLRVKKF